MSAFLQAVAGLAVVLAAIAGSAWLMKRLVRVQGAAGAPLALRGQISVGPRERVVLLEVADTWLVVGVAPGRVSALHAMPRAIALAAQAAAAAGQASADPTDAAAPAAAQPATPFAAFLQRVLPHARR